MRWPWRRIAESSLQTEGELNLARARAVRFLRRYELDRPFDEDVLLARIVLYTVRELELLRRFKLVPESEATTDKFVLWPSHGANVKVTFRDERTGEAVFIYDLGRVEFDPGDGLDLSVNIVDFPEGVRAELPEDGRGRMFLPIEVSSS